MTALYNGSSLIISRVFQTITINSIYFSLKHFVVPISHRIFGHYPIEISSEGRIFPSPTVVKICYRQSLVHVVSKVANGFSSSS